MKLKLHESAQPYSKIQKNVEKYILPALSDLGFDIKAYSLIPENAYKVCYRGTYDFTGEEPTTYNTNLVISTTHSGMDPELKDDMFATLSIDGQYIDIGGCKSDDPELFKELVKTALDDFTVPDDTVRYNNPKTGETLSLKEWKALIAQKYKELPPDRFGSWTNEELPLEVYKRYI